MTANAQSSAATPGRRRRPSAAAGGSDVKPTAGSAPDRRPAALPPSAHAPGTIERADLPGALEHAGDVDEFDAALVRGAGGVPAPAPPSTTLSEAEIETEAEAEGDLSADSCRSSPVPAGGGPARRTPAQASGAPIQEGNRAIGFLRASWAELQRVQWPDRGRSRRPPRSSSGSSPSPACTSALADYVAKEIVEFIL